MRELACPRCGARTEIVNPGIAMIVCENCQTIVYWDNDQVPKAGYESILPVNDTRLSLHASGTLSGQAYRVVGHVRYSHGRGEWDEWYLQFDDGRIAWLSEDQRHITMEVAVGSEGLPPESQLIVGSTVHAQDVAFTVTEIGSAVCLGGAGQLPFRVTPGERYTYADLAEPSGKEFATIEYDDDEPRLYRGYPVAHDQLVIDGEMPRQAVSRQGESITCTNCSGNLEMPSDREVELRVCEYCGAQLDVSSGHQRVLGYNPSGFKPNFDWQVGDAATFDGVRYEVAGRALYVETEGEQTREYLLFNPDSGYRWLAEEMGHYTLSEQTTIHPRDAIWHYGPKRRVDVGPHSMKMYWSDVVRLLYVDGALPWLAKTEDVSRYAFAVDAPKLFTVEQEGDDLEFFLGRYVEPDEVQAAFGKPPPKSSPVGVHAAQPYNRRFATRIIMIMGFIACLGNLAAGVMMMGRNGKVIYNERLPLASLSEEYLSEPFDVPDCSIVRVKLETNVNNAWIALEAALVDQDDNVVGETPIAAEYYHGVEGGESWSEGSRSESKLYQAPKAGTYRLLLQASKGGGYAGNAVELTIRAGAVMSRYFLIAGGVTGLFWLIPLLHHWNFNRRKWAPVTGDDDD